MADETLSLPAYKERLLFLGANGSGKSVLAAHMLVAGGYDYVAIDLKGDFGPPHEFAVIHKADDWRWRAGYRHIVYRPSGDDAEGKALDEMLYRLFLRAKQTGKRKPFVVYVDEGLALSKTGRTRWLETHAIATRGFDCGLWVASQRPRHIPVSVRSEAWRTYVFFLQFPEDEEEVVGYSKRQLTIEQLESGTEDFAFWELRRGQGGRVLVRRYPPLRIAEES